ncbi:hypothetical protein WJX72_000516 [[Myrmecia] bisecta]|uniref:Uncharacterized protein n=1 Tax=[Myrmecia] bisecta TaxID=41462 RepID=A0AAW1R461_9CHLO
MERDKENADWPAAWDGRSVCKHFDAGGVETSKRPTVCASPKLSDGSLRLQRKPLAPTSQNQVNILLSRQFEGVRGIDVTRSADYYQVAAPVSCPSRLPPTGLSTSSTTPIKSVSFAAGSDGCGSPLGPLPVFHAAIEGSPGCTPMPRGYGRNLTARFPVAPKKFTLTPSHPAGPACPDAGLNDGPQSCPTLSQRRPGVSGRTFIRVRVRRALNLQGSASTAVVRHSAPLLVNPGPSLNRTSSEELRRVLPRVASCSAVTRSADWSSTGSNALIRKRGDMAGVENAPKIRKRDKSWLDKSWDAAADHLARMNLRDKMPNSGLP